MKIFISYSHRDARDLEDLITHLKPLTRGSGAIEAWSDRDLSLGDDWRAKISQSISQCDAAILLISAPFLASDFIVNEELKPLMDRYGRGEIHVLCVPISFSSFTSDDQLSRLQTIPPPDRPIRKLSRSGRDQAYESIRKRIEGLSGVRIAGAKVREITKSQKSKPTLSDEVSDQRIKISDFFSENSQEMNGFSAIRDTKFTKCTIVGPALIFIEDDCKLSKCTAYIGDGDANTAFFRPASTSTVTGVMPFYACDFVDCHFTAIGFLLAPASEEHTSSNIKTTNTQRSPHKEKQS